MYASELARHQNRVVFLRYNLNLRRVFGVINTPVHNHAKPNKYAWSPLTKRSNIIIANRLEDKLKKASDKVYTRFIRERLMLY